MKLFLIRHGATPWTRARRYQGKTDVPLSREGIKQARAIARTLKLESPTRLYTSTLQRARNTAQILGQRLGLKSVADARLNELDFGRWEGAYYPGLAKSSGAKFGRWRKGILRKPPGGESITSLARRVAQFFKDIVEQHSEETVAVVSHGGPIKMFLFKVLGAKSPSIWSFRVDPGSISLIEGDRGLLQIVWVNRTDHLNSR